MIENRVEWPLWAKVYAVVVAAPMIGVCLGLSYWFVKTRIGGAVADGPPLALWTLLGTLVVAFVVSGILFGISVNRMIAEDAEALLFAATAHVLIAIPALVFLLVQLAYDSNRFLDELYYAFARREFILEFKLAIWLVFHIYMAVVVALADNTSPERPG